MLRALPIPDEDLAAQAAGGSRRAFEELVLRYGGRVVAVLERRLGDHHLALDLAQESWVRVYRAMPRYSEGRSFRSWLFAIVLNGARDEQRRRGRSPLKYVEQVPGQAPEVAAQISREAIDAALSQVAEPHRTALILVDIEQLTYQECAEALGVALGTAKSRVHRGRHLFRAAYGPLTEFDTPDGRAEAQP